jgi:hypothetical protein
LIGGKYLIKKKSVEIFFAFIVIIMLSTFEVGFAVDSDYKVWKSQQNVEVNKSWTIKFSSSVDKSTIKDNIKLIELDSKEYIDVNICYNDDNNSIVVQPLDSYDYDEEYELVIDKGIKSSNGKPILQGIKFDFKTEALEEQNFGLLKENFVKPSSDIYTPSEFYNALAYALANFESGIVLKIKNYNKSIYKLDIINDILHDHPNLDYGYIGARGSVSSYANSTEAVMNIKFNYSYSKEFMQYMKKASQDKVKEIISKVVKDGMSDYEKELALHDYLLENVEYDRRLYDGDMPEESYTDYGVLVKGTGVCDGYAKAMYRLLNSAGIETLYVTGDAVDKNTTVPHAWNIVKIDGEYYNLDATWNDPIIYGNDKGEVRHTYFNITDETLSKDHIWTRSEYPKCVSKKYEEILE